MCRSRARLSNSSATSARASSWLVPGGNSNTSLRSNGFVNRTEDGAFTPVWVRASSATRRVERKAVCCVGSPSTRMRRTAVPASANSAATVQARATRAANTGVCSRGFAPCGALGVATTASVLLGRPRSNSPSACGPSSRWMGVSGSVSIGMLLFLPFQVSERPLSARWTRPIKRARGRAALSVPALECWSSAAARSAAPRQTDAGGRCRTPVHSRRPALRAE